MTLSKIHFTQTSKKTDFSGFYACNLYIINELQCIKSLTIFSLYFLYGPYDKDLEELFRHASKIDNIVLNYLREVERVMQYPPKAFRSCRGILTLEKKYGRDRLVAACACADQKI